jgi:hypothetical protein
MQRVNFIPPSRLDAKRRVRRTRACLATFGAYTAIALLAGVACRVNWGSGKDAAEARLASAETIVEHTQLTLIKSRADLAAKKNALAVNRQLVAQPDWSRLLALLAAENGGSIVLRSVILNTRAEAAATPGVATVMQTLSVNGKQTALPPAAPPRVALLTMSGVGASQLAVTQFVVRLEKTELFKRVTTLDTRRETYLGDDAIAFRLECVLNEGEK